MYLPTREEASTSNTDTYRLTVYEQDTKEMLYFNSSKDFIPGINLHPPTTPTTHHAVKGGICPSQTCSESSRNIAIDKSISVKGGEILRSQELGHS